MTNHQTYKDAVSNLQRYLRALSDGREETNIYAIPVDGIFDDRTAEALSEFQRTRNLPITGRADKTTWDALYLEYLLLSAEKGRRSSPDIFPAFPETYQTEFGEGGAFIALLQFVLDELRHSYDSLPLFEMNGTFDGDTSLAVKEFQRIHFLPVTGRVDRRTWNEISTAYNQYGRYNG